MTNLYCDLCGKSLSGTPECVMVRIGEYKPDCCEVCARQLINFVRQGPYKGGQK